MPVHDPQRLEIANEARIGLALENEISANQARIRALPSGRLAGRHHRVEFSRF